MRDTVDRRLLKDIIKNVSKNTWNHDLQVSAERVTRNKIFRVVFPWCMVKIYSRHFGYNCGSHLEWIIAPSLAQRLK